MKRRLSVIIEFDEAMNGHDKELMVKVAGEFTRVVVGFGPVGFGPERAPTAQLPGIFSIRTVSEEITEIKPL